MSYLIVEYIYSTLNIICLPVVHVRTYATWAARMGSHFIYIYKLCMVLWFNLPISMVIIDNVLALIVSPNSFN